MVLAEHRFHTSTPTRCRNETHRAPLACSNAARSTSRGSIGTGWLFRFPVLANELAAEPLSRPRGISIRTHLIRDGGSPGSGVCDAGKMSLSAWRLRDLNVGL